MANNQRDGQGNNGGASTPSTPTPRVLSPSEIGQAVLTIVATLEPLAEQSQRRVLESVRVQLGLMPQKEAPQQRSPNGSQNQQRGGRS